MIRFYNGCSPCNPRPTGSTNAKYGSFFVQRRRVGSPGVKTIARGAALVVALALAAGAAQAATWYVAPSGSDSNAGTSAARFATIQYAINTAAVGDTINVDSGTYGESLTWSAKDLTIQGAGPGSTIIDPTAGTAPGGRCLYTESLTLASVLTGFTLRNGSEPYGTGAGILNYRSSPNIVNCAFIGNSAGAGGGIWSGSSGSSIVNCAFMGNHAWGYGGGAIDNALSNVKIVNCTLTGNSAAYGGGAIFNWASSPLIASSSFSRNSAGTMGGAIYNTVGKGALTNPTLVNNILWGNIAPTGAGTANDEYSSETLTYTDSQDLPNSTPDANGNFAADPKFVRNPALVFNLDGSLNVSGSDFGDLRLQAGSPCIDVGNNAVITAPPFPENSAGLIIDLAGNPRIVGAAVDLGAYEFQSVALLAQMQVQVLIQDVQQIVNGGAVLPANGKPLYAKLDAAIGYLQANDTADAALVLQALINQVNALVSTGSLTAAQGQLLVSQAQATITLLGG